MITHRRFAPALLLALALSCALHAAQRVPWTTSRIHGSPEPPKPFQVERVYTNITFVNPLDAGTIPGTHRLVMKSGEVIFSWLSGGHNGGNIRFGPDGMLYISTGDAESPDPPDGRNTGQDISDYLSSVLRIDVDHPEAGRPYGIPKDNPFVQTPGARGEVWAYGFRNPWRMSFDSRRGDLWVADVGWEL